MHSEHQIQEESRISTFTIETANEAGINENAMLTTIAAEKASRSCMVSTVKNLL